MKQLKMRYIDYLEQFKQSGEKMHFLVIVSTFIITRKRQLLFLKSKRRQVLLILQE